MLHLTKHTAKVENVNPRAEKHGDENKLAADIKLSFITSSHVLEHFDSHLRGALYREVLAGEQQSLIEGDRMTAVRFPRIGAVRWDEEYPGYELAIGSELGLTEPLTLVDVTLKKFSFEPLEGGSVAITCNAICHPDAEEAGALCALIQETVSLWLVPPIKQDAPEPEAANEPAPDALAQAAEHLEKAA